MIAYDKRELKALKVDNDDDDDDGNCYCDIKVCFA